VPGRSLSRTAEAAAKGDLKALRRILARSPAVLTDRDEEGLRCLDLLLDRGADPSIADGSYNATPLEWAEECGAADSADLLRRRA